MVGREESVGGAGAGEERECGRGREGVARGGMGQVRSESVAGGGRVWHVEGWGR